MDLFVVGGLPLHVLLVHFVIVLVPALALSLLLAAVWPAARRVLWIPNLLLAAGLIGLVALTVEAGDWLEDRVPSAPLIEEHADRGEGLMPWIIGLAIVAVLQAAWHLVLRRRAEDRRLRLGGMIVLTIAALVVGVGSTWTVVEIGESGTRAVWEGGFSEVPLDD